MKRYSTLLESLPAKTVVFAFGRFNPPTIGHGLLIELTKTLAKQHAADYAIYASATQDAKKNPLSVDRKIHYLNLMFPGTKFTGAGGNQRTFIEVAKHLNATYKHLIMVAGSDRVSEYLQLLNKYNGKEYHFDSIKVVSAGDRDPDADGAAGMSASKMRAAAVKADYAEFKRGLPHTIREVDGRRLMSEIREGLGLAKGLDVVREWVSGKIEPNQLREAYRRGEIFKVGEIVEANGHRYEIVDRGTNYLTVVDQSGNMSRKWLHECVAVGQAVVEDIQPGYAPSEVSFKGYTTKNLHHSADAAKAFIDTIDRFGASEPATVLVALKATDSYMGINDLHLAQGEPPDQQELAKWRMAHSRARDSLMRIGEFVHHQDYWHMHDHEIQDLETAYNPETAGAEMSDSYQPQGSLTETLSAKTIKPSDKVKVARVIADMLGVEGAETMSPDAAVNAGLRKIKNKRMTPEFNATVSKMVQLAKEVGVKVDGALMPTVVSEDVVNKQSDYNIARDILRVADRAKLMKMNTGEVGSTLDGVADDDHLRRMKARYKTEDEDKEVVSADYKTSKTGRKYPAHRLKFVRSTDMTPVSEEMHGDDLDTISDDELDKLVASVDSEEDILDLYDDDDLVLIDADTGEHIKEQAETEQLVEVLSRIERMKARVRFARTAAKRERKVQLALKRRSDSKTINKRSRRLAINLIKQRIMKKPANQLTVAEKERVERIIERRRAVIDRLAMKLAPRVRKIETERLSHSKVTQ